MLNKIFDMDNPVFRAIGTFGNIMLLNWLWIVCSLPVITMGASTTALLYASMKLHRREGYVWQNFFHSFKENFKQATALFVIFLFAGAMLGADMVLGNQMRTAFGTMLKAAACIIAIPYFITLLYVFAVQCRFVNSVKNTIRYAFFVAMRNMGDTIQMALIVVLLVWVNTTIVLFNYATISVGFGLTAYFCAAYYERVFRKYIPRGDEPATPEELAERAEPKEKEERERGYGPH